MIEEKKISIGELEFDYRTAGKVGNELVIFLHGFPESSMMWVKLMDQLASQGFYCIAPDLRGYSKNACPKGVKNYTVDKIGQDILDIADQLKYERFHLVGHDWGAAVGWYITSNFPERIISWTALSVPHNRAFGKAYKTDPVQKKKSRYIGFFLLPFIPEIVLRSGDFKRFRRLWKNCSQKELDHYLSIFRRKQSLTGALNYYRANIGKGKGSPVGDIVTPTLFVWGKTDLAISEAAAEFNHSYMKGDYKFLSVEGGHWLMQTNYQEVEEAVEGHLLKYKEEAVESV